MARNAKKPPSSKQPLMTSNQYYNAHTHTQRTHTHTGDKLGTHKIYAPPTSNPGPPTPGLLFIKLARAIYLLL